MSGMQQLDPAEILCSHGSTPPGGRCVRCGGQRELEEDVYYVVESTRSNERMVATWAGPKFGWYVVGAEEPFPATWFKAVRKVDLNAN